MFSAIAITIKAWLLLWGATFLFCKLINPIDAEWLKRKPLWIMLLFFAVGMFGRNVWVVYITMIAILPLLAKSRGEAAALFIVAMGSIPDLTTGLRIGGASILGIDKWLCLSLGFSWVFLTKPRLGVRHNHWFDIPFLLLLTLEFIQARGLNLTSTIRSLLATILTMGLPYLLLTRSIGRVADLRRLMIAFAYIGFVLAVVGIYESRSHFLIYQQIPNQLGVSSFGFRLFKIRAGMLRSVVTFVDATSFALFLAVALIAVMACRESFRSTSKFAIALLVVALGIFVTSTRNAWIGALIGIIGFDLYRRRYIALTGKVALLGMGYAVVLLLAEVFPYFAAMTGQSGDSAGTADYRTQLLTRGMEEFHKHPYLGIDGGTLLQNMQDMVQGEGIVDFVNGYLFYALTTGFGGLIALVLAFLLPCWAMLRARRAMSIQAPILHRSAAFVFAVSLNYFVTTAFTAFGGRGSTYLYVVLAIGSIISAWRKVSPELLAASDRPMRVRGRAGLVTPTPRIPTPSHAGRRSGRRGRRPGLPSMGTGLERSPLA